MSFPTQSIDFERSSAQTAQRLNALATNLQFSDIMTLETWVKLESTTGSMYIVSKRVGAGNQRSYSWTFNATQLEFVTFTDGASAGVNVTVAWTPSTGVWYHTAVTKNGTSIKFYVDGAQQGTTQTGSNGTIFNGSAPFEVGGNVADAGNDFDGRMVLMRAWSTERTVTEINNNKCSILGATTGLQGEWGFDNAYTDNSGNGYTLTPLNTPTFGADVPATCSVVGPANLKTLDTNVKANIKTYNTNTLANIKTINTNA